MSNQERKLSAIVYTDIAGFSALSAADESRALELVNLQREIVEPIVENYNGNLHKEIGDGFLITFSTVTSAVEFGIDFQRSIKQIDGLNVRIGIHEGEITYQKNDIFGDDVNICARIEPHSPVGGIAISEKVKLELGSLPDYHTEYIGEPELKGISQPIKIYCISSHGLPSPKKSVSKGAVSKEQGGLNVNILSITGLLLTVLGAAFWAWYGLGSISHGQDNDKKIFQSIAVLYLENLSNDPEGENWCAGITDGIITSISKLGVFNVKSRTDVLQFRRKVTSHDQIGEILGVDAYIAGSLQKVGEKVFANISLIDTRSGVNIWAERFEKTTSDIFNIPKIISKEIAHSLGVGISPETLSSPAFQESGDNRTFSLLGKGINLLDSGDFQKSIAVFDSVLINEPDNAHALFSRAQALENLEEYPAAIKAYEKILPTGNQYSRIQKIWEHPNLKNKKKSQDINLYERLLVSEELNIQIIPAQNKVQGLTTIFAIDLESNEEIWKKTYKFMNMAPDIIGENLILSTSSIGDSKKEATVYVHSLKTGRLVCSKEFVKEHPKQRIIVNVMKIKGNQNSEFQNIVFLNLRRDDYYEIMPLDPGKDIILWEKTFPLQAVAEGDPLIYMVKSDEKNYFLHIKGINLYLFSIDGGSLVWKKTLVDDTDKVLVHNDKIVFYSTVDTQVKINYIVNQKLIGEYDLQIPAVSALAMGENVFIRTQNSITSLRFKNRFLRGIENWMKELGDGVQIVSFHTLFNNVFALTKSGDLFCLNGASGNIVNKTNLNNYSTVSFHHDDKPKSIITYDGAFLTGIDPHNGKPLWKIRELNVHWPHNRIQLSGNRLIIMKRTDVNSQISIKAYNRTTGELLWLSNEELWPDSSSDDWQHYIGRVDKQNSLYIGTLNGLYTADLSWAPDKNYISKPNLFNRLGYCYAKNNNYSDSENILKKIVDAVDQQNETAFEQLSNLYLKQEEFNNYIKTQADFYDLVIYDDIKRLQVEEQLIENGGLQWVTIFQRKNEFSANLPESNLIVTGQCENNFGCTFSAYRKQSGVMVQEKTLDIQGCTNLTAFNDQLLFIGKIVEADDKVIYSLYNLNPETGTINGKLDLWDKGGNFTPRKIYIFDPFIIIDFDVDDIRYVTTANSATNIFIWEKEFKADLALRARNIDLIRSDSLIIAALDGQIQAMNLYTGEVDWTYEFEDDFDGIEYISQHSIHNHTLSFLSEDDEYIVLNLESREILFQKEFDVENNWITGFLNHQHIFGYLPTGELILYEKEGNRIIESWSKKLKHKIELLATTPNTIYVKDIDSKLIWGINFHNGDVKSKANLIWNPEDIFIDTEIYSIFNSRKLYLISI